MVDRVVVDTDIKIASYDILPKFHQEMMKHKQEMSCKITDIIKGETNFRTYCDILCEVTSASTKCAQIPNN